MDGNSGNNKPLSVQHWQAAWRDNALKVLPIAQLSLPKAPVQMHLECHERLKDWVKPGKL